MFLSLVLDLSSVFVSYVSYEVRASHHLASITGMTSITVSLLL